MYLVNASSSFWGHNSSYYVKDETSYTFSGLKSGTKYLFEVQTVAGPILSEPIERTYITGEVLTVNVPEAA